MLLGVFRYLKTLPNKPEGFAGSCTPSDEQQGRQAGKIDTPLVAPSDVLMMPDLANVP